MSKGIVTFWHGALAIAWVSASVASAQEKSLDLADRANAQAAIDRGIAYLLGIQGADGSWQAFGEPHPAITALAAKCIVQDSEHGPKHPAVQRAVAFVLKFAQADGGIYVPGDGHRNYHTSVALALLASLRDEAHQKTIGGARAFLKDLQWDSGEGHETSSPWYGGAGYGKHKRPDLSNTQIMIEALHDSGLPKDDPVYQRALKFISRCQMLGTTNDQTLAKESVDGGFVYTAANGGESKAGTIMVDGEPQLRSYGSMTYAAFKSMLYAGLTRDDERVKQAFRWIRKHYTLDANPNMPGAQSKEGLYYYFHVFARALAAWGEEKIIDEDGVPHLWRSELIDKLAALQKKDGSWINDEDRWYEGNPHLVTAYAVLSLQAALGR